MKEILLSDLLDRIYCAKAEELNPIIEAVTERFSEIWPDWELATLSIPGHTAEARIAAFQQALDLLIHQKTQNDLP